MYLSILKLWNFRKYGVSENNTPGLEVHFQDGVNVLIGENDSGKTAIIDAIRYVLKTHSGEYIQFEEKDFYQSKDGIRSDEFKIECVFDGLTQQDAGLFWEWLTWNDDKTKYLLKVQLFVKRKDNIIMPSFSAGPEGHTERMDAEARELLKVVYFKPLRDALTDMTHGYKSRLAQILGAHELFRTQKDEAGNNTKHKLETDYEKLKKEIERYFITGGSGEMITAEINTFLRTHFLLKGDHREAQVKLTGGELTEILRLLDLIMEGNKSGLGTLNLLCIAAEMLLFNNQKMGLKLALVEELEAHLHPQYQLRLIEYVSSQQKKEQFILSSHSITLASKIKLANLIILKGNKVYPMSREYTMMSPSDYKFLERFLDATKANLFFAKGVIFVEGDAENLLVPAIGKLIDRDLYKYGVSVVNVGSTAYKRYVNIFKRRDNALLGIPVAIISDLDIRALEYYDEDSKDRKLPRYWLKENLLAELKNISNDVDYDKLSSAFSSKSAFEEEIKSCKTEEFKPIHSIIEKMKLLLTDENRIVLNEEILTMIRAERTRKLEEKTNTDEIRIFLTNSWTLEYEIASSKLFRLLVLAIRAAQLENSHPEYEIDDNTLIKLWDKVMVDYPETRQLTKLEVYDIFAPLNNGNVSKAITAQYLAGIISGELPPVKNGVISIDEIRKSFENEASLHYLVEAIKHVTPD